MAALDVGDDQTAEVRNHYLCDNKFTGSKIYLQEYLNVLSRQFPDSARIKRLRGLQLESKQW